MGFPKATIAIVTAFISGVLPASALANVDAAPSLERQAEFTSQLVACIDRKSPENVTEFLARGDLGVMRPADIGWTATGFQKKMSFPECMAEAGKAIGRSATFNFDGALIRALLIEHRYLRANPNARNWTIPGSLPPRTFPILDEEESLARSVRAADCMTLASPDLADRLIRTTRGSGAERAAAEALTPAFATCFSDQSSQPVQVQIAPADMRRLTAESLWLLSGPSKAD